MSIFVSIAAYRDPELVPTIHDCILRARYPGDLRFGVCWQHGEDESAPELFDDPRLTVIDVPWRDSRGACWARSEIMKLWRGEDFFLQLDSHHRFVADWDARLIADAERCGAARPILSSYCASFDPGTATFEAGEAMQIDFHAFSEDGIPLCHPSVIPDWASLQRPLRARFVAAGFLFAPGAFVNEVPYDPQLYFFGEEITLAIRAFTHGYELFHPPEHILWHEYSRSYRAKHWGDHVRARRVQLEWGAREAASREKIRRFLATPHLGRFGCGIARSFADYEAYAGLSFRHRAAQDATLRGLEPPNPPTPPDWAEHVRTWQLRIVLNRTELPAAALADPPFWCVGFHDANNEEIYREDATAEELHRLLAENAREIVLERQFRSARQPASWTVWPVGEDGTWLPKVVRLLNSTGLAGGG